MWSNNHWISYLSFFVSVLIAVAGVLFLVSIIDNDDIICFRLLFLFIAAAGAFFLMNIVKQRQTNDRSYLCIWRLVHIRCLVEQSRGKQIANKQFCCSSRIGAYSRLLNIGMFDAFSRDTFWDTDSLRCCRIDIENKENPQNKYRRFISCTVCICRYEIWHLI